MTNKARPEMRSRSDGHRVVDGLRHISTLEHAPDALGGLENIRARIEELGGILSVASKPGRGTVLRISLPWPARVRRG